MINEAITKLHDYDSTISNLYDKIEVLEKVDGDNGTKAIWDAEAGYSGRTGHVENLALFSDCFNFAGSVVWTEQIEYFCGESCGGQTWMIVG